MTKLASCHFNKNSNIVRTATHGYNKNGLIASTVEKYYLYVSGFDIVLYKGIKILKQCVGEVCVTNTMICTQ